VSVLDTIRSPADLRALPADQLRPLADEVRERILDVVSEHKGAHFGSNLGTVELSIALHRVFDTPTDQLIWDVGHQAYTHKILTGRNELLPTIRRKGGLSGFLRREESPYDVFGAGHAATSIAAACGIAAARDLHGEDFEVVAVIGDGSMSCGLAFEALNNVGDTDRDLIVVLNDNQMSISPNVGAMHRSLTNMRTNPLYNRVRDEVKRVIHAAPRFGSLGGLVEQFAVRMDDAVKGMFVPGMLFEELGLRYVGPVDGHDLDRLIEVFDDVRRMKGPRIVHVLTTKGKGFAPAEEDQVKWHASGGFDKLTGAPLRKASTTALPRYQNVFGEALTALADEYPQVVAITAAMATGTSTDVFQRAHPDRFYDVGIAEAHAVTFAAGLATQAVKPVVAIYSTFLQRAYDSIVHDVALQGLPVLFCLDRAGLAGDDGPTHHGGLDIAYLLAVPGMTVTAPMDGEEMIGLLRLGIEWSGGPFSVRWPRDSVPAAVPPPGSIPPVPYGTWTVLREGADVVLLAAGTMVLPSLEAASLLAARGIEATVVNCRFLKPLDEKCLASLFPAHRRVVTVEEGTVVNGFGSYVRNYIGERWSGVQGASLGLPDRFVEHGERSELLAEVGLTAAGIAEQVQARIGAGAPPSLRETA
jgi:1-deoxy-D-xylulose-5-phosphate synthase